LMDVMVHVLVHGWWNVLNTYWALRFDK
jgi:hypothetical protein